MHSDTDRRHTASPKARAIDAKATEAHTLRDRMWLGLMAAIIAFGGWLATTGPGFADSHVRECTQETVDEIVAELQTAPEDIRELALKQMENATQALADGDLDACSVHISRTLAIADNDAK